MKRILVPVDGSPRSLVAIEQIKTTFSPKAFEVVLVMVRENTGYVMTINEESEIREEMNKKLSTIAKTLDQYKVITRTAIGRAGSRIIEAAKELGVDMIVMTKSTKPGSVNSIGLTASYIIRHSQCDIMIVRESENKKVEGYRGAIYKRAKGNVALRGQLSLKQSECLLPSVKGDVVYNIEVTRGRVRFLHRSFNSVTKEWDLPPSNGQQEVYEIDAGEKIAIHVNATGVGKMADRIRILNRNMKTEAVFNYEITADKGDEFTEENVTDNSNSEVHDVKAEVECQDTDDRNTSDDFIMYESDVDAVEALNEVKETEITENEISEKSEQIDVEEASTEI